MALRRTALPPAAALLLALSVAASRETPPLFGLLREPCGAADEHCVTVADSYGLPRAARLGGRGLSPVRAALALLQEQHAAARWVNGTEVTPANVRELLGIEPWAAVDGRAASLQQLEAALGSGRDLRLAWRPTARAEGLHPLAPHVLLELAGEGLERGHDEWFIDAIKGATKTITTMVLSPELITGFTSAVRSVMDSGKDFFGCLQSLPENKRLEAVSSLIKKMATDTRGALKEILEVWLKPSIETLQTFVAGQLREGSDSPVVVQVGPSAKNSRCFPPPSIGHIHCSADAGNPGKRVQGGKGPETFEVLVVDELLCVRRTDTGGGWDINLAISCEETMVRFPVLMGQSTASKKCISVNAVGARCSKGAASEPGPYANNSTATFVVTVESGEGVTAGGRKTSKVCAERVDKATGWDHNLKFVCHANSHTIDFSNVADGNWKVMLIEKAWVRLHDLTSMPHMELGQCVMKHLLTPLKAKVRDIALLGLRAADLQVKAFVRGLASTFSQALAGFFARVQGEVMEAGHFVGLSLKNLRLSALGVVKQECMAAVQGAALASARSLAATADLNLAGKVVPALAFRVIKKAIKEVGDFIMKDVFMPLVNRVKDLIVSASGELLLLIEGICGVIPEIGAVLCESITSPIADGLNYVQQAMRTEAEKMGVFQFASVADRAGDAVGSTATSLVGLAEGLSSVSVETVAEGVQQGLDMLDWVGGDLVQPASAHSVLDKAYLGLLRHVAKAFMLIIPELEAELGTCVKLHRDVVVRKQELAVTTTTTTTTTSTPKSEAGSGWFKWPWNSPTTTPAPTPAPAPIVVPTLPPKQEPEKAADKVAKPHWIGYTVAGAGGLLVVIATIVFGGRRREW